MLEAHHHRGDGDAALALDRDPTERTPPPRASTSPASWIAPPNSSNFSGKVVLPASGCEMIAKAPACNLVGQGIHLSALAVVGMQAVGHKRSRCAGTCGGYDERAALLPTAIGRP
jgi:hypothetical protein